MGNPNSIPKRRRTKATFIEIADYLKRYILEYRNSYERFTAPPPQGGGYFKLNISPYIYSKEINCYVAVDGVVIADYSWEPSDNWYIAGGPAIKVDSRETKSPPWVKEILSKNDLLGKSIGIYRMVAKTDLPIEMWMGDLNNFRESLDIDIDEETKLIVRSYDLSLEELIQRVTFGALCNILDIHLGNRESNFWQPHIIRNLGIFPADLNSRRFFHYMELLPHIDYGAWDQRNIAIRVQVDVRRDYRESIAALERSGGTISIGTTNSWIEHFHDRLSKLYAALVKFEEILDANYEGDEAIFHNYLQANPILLDVYGITISKPRFYYPEGQSPLGKIYVEPDFIIRYPNQSYKLVELERPSKQMATKKGQTRSEVSQAMFQIAEWTAFIKNNYEVIRSEFPGIAVNYSTMLVMSRSTQRSIGEGRDFHQYMELVRQQYSADEIYTYDDLIARAKQAYTLLSSLSS